MSRAARRAPSDQPARDRARTGLSESSLLEAGAGTGKTTVLLDRVAEILKTEVPLEKIAVITFTEKAAGELKLRLRRRLEDELAAIEPQQSWSRVLKEALESLDRAMVTTIHSFAASLLRERPVEADVDPRFTVADELTATMLLEETWERWIEREMAGGGEPLATALRLGITLDQLRALAFDLAGSRDARPEPPPAEDAGLVAARDAIVAGCAELSRLAGSCRNEDDAGLAVVRGLAARVETMRGVTGPKLLARLDELDLNPRAGAKPNWSPPEDLTAVKRIVGDLRERRDEATRRARTRFAHAVALWIHDGFLHAYRAAKDGRRLLDFEDLLLLCRDMLRDSRAARLAFAERFTCLLVDEFQDTDPLQAEILFLLASSDPDPTDWRKTRPVEGKLFVVGDPKQSIYRFRRADIEVYEESRRLLTPDGVGDAAERRLIQNFRTVPSIVSWVNDLFGQLIVEDTVAHHQPRYEPIAAYRAEPDPVRGCPKEAASRVVLLAPRRPEALDEAGAEEVRVAEARHVVALIRKAVGERWTVVDEDASRPVRYGDVALLFRTSTGIDAYEAVLREHGVPYRIAGGKRYYMRSETRALQAVLEAVESPHDPLAVVSALRCPFFGHSDEELLTHSASGGDWVHTHEGAGRGTPFERSFDLLARLHAARNTRSIAATLEDLFESTGAVSLFYLKPDGDQRAANLLKAIDLARAHETLGGATFGSFVRWLSSMAEAEREEGEAPLAEQGDSGSDDTDAVRISTVHKAKGLEFPMVVLCDAAGRGRNVAPGLVVERAGEAPRLEFAFGPAAARFVSDGYDDAAAREKQRLEAESARLFYVAATRARDYLVVPVFGGKNPGGIFSVLGDAGFLPERAAASDGAPAASHRGAWVLDGGSLETTPAEAKPFRLPVTPEAGDPAFVLEKQGWRMARKVALSAPPLGRTFRSASGMERTPVGGGTVRDAGRSDPARSRALGTAVHAVLERIDLATGRNLDLLAEEEAAGVGRPELAEEVEKLARKALTGRIVKEALASPRWMREMPFVAAGETFITEGRVDLVFESGGGLTIVDFKTDDVSDEAGVSARVAAYEPQALIYARALSQITGLTVNRVVFHFIRPGLERTIKVDEGFLARGRQLLEAGPAAGSP